jgi:glycosyltransferase involved in cell wall biosynthesis
MIYVLHYVYKMSRGGIETLIMNLYRNIDREKIQFDFAVHTRAIGDYDEEINKLGGNIIYFPPLRKNIIKYLRAWHVFWKYNAFHYSVFHFHTPTLANIYPLIKANQFNVTNRIVHSHNTYASRGKLQLIHNIIHRYNSKRITKYANHFFSCSKPASKWLFGNENTDSLNIKIFKNGINTKSFIFNKKIRDSYRRKLDLENKIVIGHIGRFVKQKNHSFLIDIFNNLYIKNNIVLLLIGEGELIIDVKTKVNKLGLNEYIKFLGVREDVNNILMAMDLFLFPSLHEGLGVVLIEAQASGLPVLTSNRVPLEIKCTDNIKFKDLNDSSKDWAAEVMRMIKINNRTDQSSNVKKAGYDIKNVTKNYENFLLKHR